MPHVIYVWKQLISSRRGTRSLNNQRQWFFDSLQPFVDIQPPVWADAAAVIDSYSNDPYENGDLDFGCDDNDLAA